MDGLAKSFAKEPVVFLEFLTNTEHISNRQDRFMTAWQRDKEPLDTEPFLPNAMIGSGRMISVGERDFQKDFREMVDSELERAPEAALYARKERPSPSSFVVKLQLTNHAPVALTTQNMAMLHVILYQGHRALSTGKDILRSHEEIFSEPLEPGHTRRYEMEFTGFRGVNLSQVEAVAYVDYIPPDGDGRWDMLQGAKATTADLPDIPEAPEIDLPPTVAEPLEDLQLLQDANPKHFDLSTVFTDPDDDDLAIVERVILNSNPDLVDASIDDHILTLVFMSGASGNATIEIQADSDGQSVTDDFEISVEPEPDEPEPPVEEQPGPIYLPQLMNAATLER